MAKDDKSSKAEPAADAIPGGSPIAESVVADSAVSGLETQRDAVSAEFARNSFAVSDAGHHDFEEVQNFLLPFMDGKLLLRRTSLELELLLKHSFKATIEGRIVGFCAIEIYSKKLAEIQCLAVLPELRRQGVGRELVRHCVQRANEQKVLELMAITSSEDMFMACGFDYSLPHQKRALFIQP